MKVKDMIKVLEGMNPESEIIRFWWAEEDIVHKAAEMKQALNAEQIESIVYNLEEHLDANDGICWDTIESAIEEELGL